jgi:cytochrome c biogenesis protein CcmG, thiol:disulfide interchange protein DsbE
MFLKHAFLAACAATALALGACGGDDDSGNPESELSAEEATAPLQEAPAELQDLRADANQLLGGGTDAFGERLDSLRGTPVVVNSWASWCGPCRVEFPFFQAQAEKLATEVAFLGVDSEDSDDAAETFLRELPLPYPSYSDPEADIRKEFLDSPVGYPATAFYDSTGELAYVHQGPYATEEDLAAEIKRYAQ